MALRSERPSGPTPAIEVDLVRAALRGGPLRVEAGSGTGRGTGTAPLGAGVLGVDVAPRSVDRSPMTVVQVLLDDDDPSFDVTLLDALLVAELLGDDGRVLAREPFDHDAFRRRLRAERDAGENAARGVLVLTEGELPPAWVRLAFLPVAITGTAGCTLVVRRTTPAELVVGIEEAFALGEISDAERQAVLVVIDQRHPDPG